MKLKNLKTKRHTLLSLHLLKFQIYKRLNKKIFFNSINKLELKIKQILQLIYLYHYNDKRILFIGFPYIKTKCISNYSKHIFIPKKIDLNNIIEHKHFIDLVVIFNPTKKDFLVLKEFNNVKKPIIFLGNLNEVSFLNTLTYSINGVIINKYFKQFCYFLVYTILKKPKLIK